MLRKALYRAWQTWFRLTAFARPIDDRQVQAVLSPALYELFKRMPRSEQLHSLRVMQTLRAQGHDHPALLTAALLHDVGKSRYPFSLIGRVVAVLGWKVAPERAQAWGTVEPHGWKRPFVIGQQHPAWSAEDMAAEGAPALAVELARRHAEIIEEAHTEADRLLLLLKAADDSN